MNSAKTLRKTAQVLPLVLAFSACQIWSETAVKGQVTREQIIAYAEECKAQGTQMNLIEKFGRDFSSLDLSDVDLRGAHTVGLETNLTGADFTGAKLRRTQFGAAVLDGANFSNADLGEASFITASLIEADLTGADLNGTTFYQSDLIGAQLSNADLSQAAITGSNFAGADLSGARLAGAVNEYWWSDFSFANLSGAQLQGLKLKGARFDGANLQAANLAGADLEQASFVDADLRGTNFANANVQHADFTDVRGVSDKAKEQLENRAARWELELQNTLNEALTAAYVPIYLLILALLAWLSIRQNRAPQRNTLSILATITNGIALLPALGVVWLHNSGAATTVQFNVNSEAAMSAWSTWVGIWPLYFLLALACTGVAAVLFFVFVFNRAKNRSMRNHWLHLVHHSLTIAHCWFSLQLIGSNFPSA